MLINVAVSSRFRSGIVLCKYIYGELPWLDKLSREQEALISLLLDARMSCTIINFDRIRIVAPSEKAFLPFLEESWREFAVLCNDFERELQRSIIRVTGRERCILIQEKSGTSKDLNPTKNARRIGRKIESRRIYSIYHRLKQLDGSYIRWFMYNKILNLEKKEGNPNNY